MQRIDGLLGDTVRLRQTVLIYTYHSGLVDDQIKARVVETLYMYL